MESRDECSNHEEMNSVSNSSLDTGSLEAFTEGGFKMLVEATKRSNNLPFSKARDYYESYPSFHNLIAKQSGFVLSVLSLMMRHANCKGNIQKRDDEDKFEMIVDANDSILENVGISLDELSGIKRNPEPEFKPKETNFINGSWNKNNKVINSKVTTEVLNKILSQTKNIEKPQLYFRDKINNDSAVPFEPKIKYKYNILKPLAVVPEFNEDGICQFTHPYGFELEKFKPPKDQMTCLPPKLYKPLEDTPFFFITKPEEVSSMTRDLEKYQEIAVDLEHHSYRSFQGFTCLMQISTRDTDYVVDTLLLRSDLEVLNKVLTNPSIVKVFHGADLDILWLQRDFGLYIVNMFDTHQAAKLLQFPKLSLAYLLSYYCNVDAQKHFQLADWRVRPLPQELLKYAREDTHYLLYIYDNLRNALIEKGRGEVNLLESVISESTRICLKRYIKPLYESEGYLDIYHRSKKLFDNRQKFALQKLFEWRDKMARELDESYAYVLPNHMMLNISEVLPREAQGILASCNPVPVPIRQNLLALHQIILKAREQPLIKPVLEEQRFYRCTATNNSFESPLLCPHDLNHEGEFRDDLPILFNEDIEFSLDTVNASETCFLYSKPIINVFENATETIGKVKLCSVTEKALRLSPYHRYKLAKKFAETLDAKQLNKINKNQLEANQPLMGKKPSIHPLLVTEEGANQTKGESDVRHDNTRSVPDKRQVEEDDNIHLIKKIKAENNSFVKNPFYGSASNNEKERFKKKKKSNRFAGSTKLEFQPFDYNSVDFEKYRNSTIVGKKKMQRKLKSQKKCGKKNFKLSI